MATVLVRHLDPAMVRRLKARAKRHGRSLQAELKQILEQAATPEMPDWRKRIDALRAQFAGRRFTDSTALIRRDRQR